MDNPDLLQIHQTWTDLREARVKDGFIFRVSRYFIDHWLRLLGPKAAWAVVDLQQRCYLKKSNFCQASLQELCSVTGVGSTTTMQRIVDEPLMRWFFAKQNTRRRRGDKVVRGKNQYHLQMSDPLTPTHQGQIARLLAERLRDGTVPAVRGADDLLRLISDIPPLSTLPADDLPAWATREPLNLRQITLRVLSQAGVTGVQAQLSDEAALRQAFAEAQAGITQPTRIALSTHYFRSNWVPHLGATNAWLITILRSRCYWNKERGQVRDICFMSNEGLADLLGVSRRTVIRGLKNALVNKFVAAQERAYAPSGKGPIGTRFQVRLTLDPLTPPDEADFAAILQSNAARYGLDPATGQMNMLDILDMMSQMTSDEIAQASENSSDKIEIRNLAVEPKPSLFDDPEAPSRAITSDKIGIRPESSDKSEIRTKESSDKIGTIPSHSSDKTEIQYLNTLNTAENEKERKEQQQYPAAEPSLPKILSLYGIEEPALSQIAANSQVTRQLAQAWILYANDQAGLKQKAAYVIKRLNKSPPDIPSDPDLMLVAGIEQNELKNFARRRTLELQGACVTLEDERREAQYQAWLRFYGHAKDLIHDDGTTVECNRKGASRWRPDVG